MLENFLISLTGLEKVFDGLEREEIAALDLLKFLKELADVSVFENMVGNYSNSGNEFFGKSRFGRLSSIEKRAGIRILESEKGTNTGEKRFLKRPRTVSNGLRAATWNDSWRTSR